MSKREIIRIYTNESVNVAIAEGLRRRGVNAISAKDVRNLGLTDEDQSTRLINSFKLVAEKPP